MTTQSASTPNSASAIRASWLPLMILVLAQLQMGFNINALPVSIGPIAEDLNAPATAIGTALVVYSMFIAVFNYSNLPRVIAVALAGVLEQANIGALPLLIMMMLAIVLLDFIMPGSVPKWAIFAPIFVPPLFIRLGVAGAL